MIFHKFAKREPGLPFLLSIFIIIVVSVIIYYLPIPHLTPTKPPKPLKNIPLLTTPIPNFLPR
jgi:hypothetical protein